jgi:uncharacterized membrane protein
MIKIDRTITIHRPVEDVFAYISDVEHGPRNMVSIRVVE